MGPQKEDAYSHISTLLLKLISYGTLILENITFWKLSSFLSKSENTDYFISFWAVQSTLAYKFPEKSYSDIFYFILYNSGFSKFIWP